jgi:acetyltransferase-like isoleucine patch superfamily enzyme
MGDGMHEIQYQIRYALPLWLISILSCWWPDNRITIRARGVLISLVLPDCGKNLTLGRDVTLLAADRLSVGDHVYLAKGTWINAIGGVKLGDEVVTSPYVIIASSNHGFRDGSVRFGGAHPAKISVGKGSWIGSHAVVTAGVAIGSGNLIGANAVVTKSTEDNAFVGGIPARIIGERIDNPGNIHSRSQTNE